jgi:hypothetical protein
VDEDDPVSNERGELKAVLTIFTAPKPFQGLIDIIQRNAVSSWLQMGSLVEVLLIGDEGGIAEVADQMGVHHYPQVERNDLGTPLVNSIFQIAHDHSRNPYLCFVNTDIIIMDDLLSNLERISKIFEQFLIVGQRWDMSIDELIRFDKGWSERLRKELRRRGNLHPPAGSDYFIFPRSTFDDIPALTIGRAGWDNWMIYKGRAKGIAVIDATSAITIIHQDHDYDHLPEGKPHYNLPESDDNVRLGGGQETIFTLNDANWIIRDGELERRGWVHAGIVRALETLIVLRLGPGRWTRILLALLHPWETFRYYLGALTRTGRTDQGEG